MKQNSNVAFWYIESHCYLHFIRAQADGIWDLHLVTFRSMIPLFMTYDHQSYSRWGQVYSSTSEERIQQWKFCGEAFIFHIQPGRS